MACGYVVKLTGSYSIIFKLFNQNIRFLSNALLENLEKDHY